MTALLEARDASAHKRGSTMPDNRSWDASASPPFNLAEDAPHREPGEALAPLLDDFQKAIDLRVARERQLAAEQAEPDDEQERELRAQLATVDSAHASDIASLEADYQLRREAALVDANADESSAHEAHLSRIREIEARYYRETADVEARYEDSSWVTSSVLDDEAEDSPLRQYERATQARERSRDQQIEDLASVESALYGESEDRESRELTRSALETPPRSLEEAQQKFSAQIEEARACLAASAALKLPRLFRGYGWLVLFLVVFGATAAPLYLFVPGSLLGFTDGAAWAAVSAGAGAVIGLLLLGIVYAIGAHQQSDLKEQAVESLDTANTLHQIWRDLAARDLQKVQADFDARQAAFTSQRQSALERFQRAHDERRAELERTRTQDLQIENTRYAEQQQKMRAAAAGLTVDIDAEYAEQRQALITAVDSRRSSLQSMLDDHVQRRRRRQAELWHTLKSEWDAATRQLESELQQAQAASRALFRDWSELAGGGWTPATELPPGIRRGQYDIDLNQWPNAVPADMRLAPRVTQFALPSITQFPDGASLMLRTPNAASRSISAQMLQSLLLRWLTLVPPGKLRLTILDPVGLGESFAGFMHLADFDELLVTTRIWTEPDQIEQQLADLTQHMENVLQKYLRNEFATIEEYNTFAGEVAEPYRLLVISDFPAKFSELAARRLTSIISSGPRCGVFTLLSVDPRRQLPHGFDPAILDENLPTLDWTQYIEKSSSITDLLQSDARSDSDAPATTAQASEPGFRTRSGILARWPISIDAPPPPDQFTALVRRIGEASKDARRVEVSFDRIAPRVDQLWTHSSRQGIDIPLGRAGATKHQHLRLGKGTSQHMLIAGKTGSGKSTFLHCLITNLALHYSPDEVRFSLVDFKKGVEFKQYAALQLPHADVIAIESDREFGVSVLQRLDGVLQERGDMFRRQGVQDLASFRAACPEVPLPRLLLVIDEFQEFFVEEDRLSQSAALLLDRLIRQGRAFGMHVVLGSQTLGGAYSLARSTMGQVAVRVALQCSEADAHLILSEENTAARLLTRPGEAIYNDANGLVEGNHPFQIAWLPDEQRESWLRRLQSLAVAQGRRDPPAIVFEGNIPSDPARNLPLVKMLRERPIGEATQEAPKVWLGEAVEIRPPTALSFERRNGANLLLVGQDSDAALGILTTAAVTLSAQTEQQADADDAPIIVLDGSVTGSPEAATWQSLSRRFAGTIRVAGPRDTESALRSLSDEMQRRLAEPDAVHAPRFLFVHHLSRFRDLRKGDDDFGMSFGGGSEKPVDPSKLFADVLASGPLVGIHTLIWCDSANTVERWFSRNSMRELENRVVFQMNSSDSSNLVDSPAAAKLGVHRALLYREETGVSEKFRPYHVPDSGWLQITQSKSAATVEAPAPSTATAAVSPGAAEPGAAQDLANDLSEFRIL